MPSIWLQRAHSSVIQGAKGLVRNVRARMRQPAPAGHSQSIAPAERRAWGQQIPSRGGGEKQDLVTLRLCLLLASTPSTQSLPRAFSPPPWRLNLSRLPRAPAQAFMPSPHPPRQAVLGTGDSHTECRSPPLLPVSALFCAVSSVSVLGSPSHRDGRDLTCHPPPAPPIQPMGSLRPSLLT